MADGGEIEEFKGEGDAALMYLGASLGTTLNVAMGIAQALEPTWKAVPTLRLECPPTFEMGRRIVGLKGPVDVDSR